MGKNRAGGKGRSHENAGGKQKQYVTECRILNHFLTNAASQGKGFKNKHISPESKPNISVKLGMWVCN